jgi:3-phenylpropionate/trans-cinnamate dioxygenase ferredoxin subunit
MTTFVNVLRLNELPATGYVTVAVGAYAVLVARLGNDVFAVENRCSHADSELAGGRLKMGRLSCPLHGAMFDFRTGASMGGTLALRGLRTFKVRVTGDEVALADTPCPGIARAERA